MVPPEATRYHDSESLVHGIGPGLVVGVSEFVGYQMKI